MIWDEYASFYNSKFSSLVLSGKGGKVLLPLCFSSCSSWNRVLLGILFYSHGFPFLPKLCIGNTHHETNVLFRIWGTMKLDFDKRTLVWWSFLAVRFSGHSTSKQCENHGWKQQTQSVRRVHLTIVDGRFPKTAEALGPCTFPGWASFAEAHPQAARLVHLLRHSFKLLGDMNSRILWW